MTDAILVLNAGSSSIKFALYPVEAGKIGWRMLRGNLSGIGNEPHLEAKSGDGRTLADETPAGVAHPFTHEEALPLLMSWLRSHMSQVRVIAAGHRVVHGGESYSGPVLIDTDVIEKLKALIPLARLHEPFELAGICALRHEDRNLPQVACFDTGFHHTQPEIAQLFPLPRTLIDAGVKRYGFHGLSYEYIASVLALHLGSGPARRVLVAHLGSGSSMCALLDGRSIATTMGFTALDGLMMGTRPGALDPGVLLYLIQEKGMSPEEVNHLLYHESGLLGVSGISPDMRVLLGSAEPHARQAIELYVYRAVREAGALVACLGGLDAIVFTAGIGERAAPVRAAIGAGLAWLGLALDPDANAANALRISTAASPISTWVIPTDEEIVVARHTLGLVQS